MPRIQLFGPGTTVYDVRFTKLPGRTEDEATPISIMARYGQCEIEARIGCIFVADFNSKASVAALAVRGAQPHSQDDIGVATERYTGPNDQIPNISQC